jgi:Replication-relaxation
MVTTPSVETAQESQLRTARKICVNGVEVEQTENGQVNQQKRRRPLQAVALQRPTNGGLSPSHSLGPRGVETTPKARRWSPSLPTPNSDHINGDLNGSFNSTLNGSTVQPTIREGEKATTAWDLPDLIRPLPIRRCPTAKRPRILAHYPAVVEFVYANRFATGSQIQRRFSRHIATRRTAQYQMAALVQLGYLQTAPVRSTSPNFPFVYAASGRGVRLVADTYASLGVNWKEPALETTKTSGIALHSILHELLTTEFDLAVWKTIKSRGDLSRLFHERRYFQHDKQLRFVHNGQFHRVVPDSGFLLKMEDQTSKRLAASPFLLLHFVELDNGTMSLSRIFAKFQMYEHWARSEEGQKYLQSIYNKYGKPRPQINFRLLVVAHAGSAGGNDFHRLIDLLMQTIPLSAAMRDRIWLTTAEQIRREQESPAPLSASLWLRARDIKSWLPAIRHLKANFSSEKVLFNSLKCRKFVTEQVRNMPLHPLFPTQFSAI